MKKYLVIRKEINEEGFFSGKEDAMKTASELAKSSDREYLVMEVSCIVRRKKEIEVVEV